MAAKTKQQIIENLKDKFELPEGMLEKISTVIRIMSQLRAPGGCPWDKVQTHESLLKNLLEESYEFIDTVKLADDNLMREELGDLFMQVIFHAEIAAERSAFDLGDVASDLADKLIRRHQHVFGERVANNQEEALKSWNDAKGTEGKEKHSLDAIPMSMPALVRARKIQEKVARVGFEWPEIDGAMEKVDEELAELKEAIEIGDPEKIGEELGDLLFVVVNVARYVKHCPEVALTGANEKFIRRFKHIEKRLAETGRTTDEATLEEMDVFWDEAKDLEKRGKC